MRCLRSCHNSSLLVGFCQFIGHNLPGTSNWSNRSDLFVNYLSFFWRPSTFARSCELILISSTFKTRPPTKRFVLDGDFSWKQWRPAPRGCHQHNHYISHYHHHYLHHLYQVIFEISCLTFVPPRILFLVACFLVLTSSTSVPSSSPIITIIIIFSLIVQCVETTLPDKIQLLTPGSHRANLADSVPSRCRGTRSFIFLSLFSFKSKVIPYF